MFPNALCVALRNSRSTTCTFGRNRSCGIARATTASNLRSSWLCSSSSSTTTTNNDSSSSSIIGGSSSSNNDGLVRLRKRMISSTSYVNCAAESPPPASSTTSGAAAAAAAAPIEQLYPDAAYISKNPIVQQLWSARQKAKNRSGRILTKKEDLAAAVAAGKTPSESRVEIMYAFSSDKLLAETYKNPWGQMRLGRTMEDLDALAGNIAFFHVDQGQAIDDQPILVTASVDRICLSAPPPELELDQHLSGQVTWTGTASMEICMQCRAHGSPYPWLEAYFTFVTLDNKTHKPTAMIPMLLPESPCEQSSFDAGAVRAALKKERRKVQKAVGGGLATNSEAAVKIDTIANELMQEASALLNMPSLADPNSILVDATKMQNAVITQPQVQNLHSRIFGGYLMRRAFELAFSNAYVFGGSRPVFLEVDEVSFASPVEIGDLLVFNSCILYTNKGRLSDYYNSFHGTTTTTTANGDDEEYPLVHVEVEAWVTEPEKVTSRLSNQFHFTFAITSGKSVRRVLPDNIGEARRVAARMEANQEQSKSDEKSGCTY